MFHELEVRSAREHLQPSMLTAAPSAAGDMEAALGYAGEALASRDPLFTLLARRWPGHARLRTGDRFVEIVAALNLPNW